MKNVIDFFKKKNRTKNIVALITPMKKNGCLDYFGIDNVIKYQISNKIDGILVAGTTGEASTLKEEEYVKLLEIVLEHSCGKIPVFFGIHSNSTTGCIEIIKKVKNYPISAFLTVVPYYNLPNQEGIYKHFMKISEFSNIPQIIYNVPKRTGSKILTRTIYKLSKFGNIIGIKECSKKYRIYKNLKRKKFLFFSGNDSTFIDFIKNGGNGVISTLSNAIPDKISKICSLLDNKEYKKVNLLKKEINSLFFAISLETNPIVIKYICKSLRIIKNSFVRLPLTELNKKNKKIVKNIIKKYKKIT
ncbi:4-hydroxy-tetrahydrodipicolinate synthase [bacterium endosymbiont of Pedicinus badii]|uniref:4-hydroxy-tetrahydrodipicolinate synthase n=1 Tax=bacterium endosymbiont of Pedicinus badii TaxID=1719126 RepID=UPI0009BBF600|nr:4-hydroxy-tetrahydrodipicolinate synthase [bacterium endosymbiont of Pedicinus badii]OQM34477.1 hypothetical protein AOQ89_01145 [bacterium endosymbiont of Pedicinus badii]